jgi:hypothetical protein
MLDSEFLFSSLDSEVLSFASTALNLQTPTGNHQQFSGTFIYNVDPATGEPDFIDGTITELAESGPNFESHYWAQELTLPLVTWSQFLLANDAAGLQAYVLNGADRILGSQLDDVLAGYNGDDVFDGKIGNDTIYGGAGNDLAYLRGLRSNWQIVKSDGKIVATDLTGTFGTDTLYEVEQFQFDDQLVVVNRLPTISPVSSLPRGTTTVAASSLFSTADADGDAITRYRFQDVNIGGTRFILNGVAQPEGATFEVSAAQLAGLQMQLGSPGYTNAFSVQVYDGYSWSDRSDIQIVTPFNSAPVLSVADKTATHGATALAATSLFTVSDPDGDPVTAYKFFDGTQGGGRFRKNGVAQAELANIDVSAAELATFDFAPGSGSDALWVQAFDGVSWSNWKSFTLFGPPNNVPVVAINGGSLNPARGTTTIAAASFFSVTDADGDAITQYRFYDGTQGNGRFELNGTPQTELANITINAGDLANFAYRVGGSGDTLWVQAYDGSAWSAWKSFNVSAPANAAPSAAVSDRSPARGTTSLAAASLVSVTDADGDPITAYRFFDGTQGSGHFRKNGVAQAELVNIDVSAAELATTDFVLGGGNDVLWVQAYDGISWSSWKSFTVNAPANNAPVVSINGVGLNPGRVATVAASSFFSVTDADNDTITQYRFFDGTQGNGRFELNATPQAELANLTIAASDLANFRYRTSTTGTGDTLWVQAFDGISWSTWKSFNVAAPTNNAPVVSVSDKTPGRGTATLSAASLFSVTDADGDTITAYKFFDGTGGSGHFRKGGVVQADMVNIDVSAAELATTDFQLGAGSDVLWVQAYDGISWSAWKSFTVFPPANNAPVVTVNQAALNPGKGTATVAASSFFSVSDADADTMTQFRFFDGTAGNGRFQLNGVDQTELANVTVNAGDLANFTYRTSTTGVGDTLWVQAFDGTSWSTWKSFNVTAPVNVAPTVFVEDWVYNDDPGVVPASSLFVVTDPDDANMVKYRFFDSELGTGRFQLNGVDQVQRHNLEIDAADLPNLTYLTGAADKEQIWVQAFDGTAWSQWKSFEARSITYGVSFNFGGSGGDLLIIDPNHPPVAAATSTSANAGSAVAVGNLVSATDADGDAITKWAFLDTTTGRGAFSVGGVTQPDNQRIEVMATQLSSVQFLAGNTTGFNRLQVAAFDGTEWSDWKPFIINTLASS